MSQSEKKERAALTKSHMGIQEGIPLEVTGESPSDLRKGLQMLMDIEAIKRLKHSYFRCIDTANFEELADLFHEDVAVHFKGGFYEWKLEGREKYLDSVQSAFTQQSVGHHNGHHPEIQILSEKEATGIWYLADHMWMLNYKAFTQGTALYWDRYLKCDGKWKIRETKYERIYELNQQLEEAPPFSVHYLAEHGTRVD